MQPRTTQKFLMIIYNVPADLKEEDLTLQHELITDWKLLDVVNAADVVARVSVATSQKLTAQALEGSVSVSSKVHEVQGTEVYLFEK